MVIALTQPPAFPSSELKCIAATVYGEARGESDLGQILVARTVLNRVDDARWPQSPCRVVRQRRQYAGFSEAVLRRPAEVSAWERATAAALAAAAGSLQEIKCSSATHFHEASVRPSWVNSDRMVRLCQVDNHIFYKELPYESSAKAVRPNPQGGEAA